MAIKYLLHIWLDSHTIDANMQWLMGAMRKEFLAIRIGHPDSACKLSCVYGSLSGWVVTRQFDRHCAAGARCQSWNVHKPPQKKMKLFIRWVFVSIIYGLWVLFHSLQRLAPDIGSMLTCVIFFQYRVSFAGYVKGVSSIHKFMNIYFFQPLKHNKSALVCWCVPKKSPATISRVVFIYILTYPSWACR